MRSELRATPDLEQLALAPKRADEVLRLGLQDTVAEHEELDELLRMEQQRLIAKYGAESPQAKNAAVRLDLHEQMNVGIKIYSERLSMRAPETSPDRFVIYGRVLSSEGEGLSNLIVAARDQKSKLVDQATTDDLGGFELSLSAADHLVQPSSETIDVAGLRGLDERLTLRLEVTDRRRKKLYSDEEPFEVIPGLRSYREIVLSKDPGATRTKKSRSNSPRAK